jgi:hypothetical protein
MVTALHESGHILHGHTEPERMKEYLHHRGLYEFEAEATAYIVGHELDVTTEQQAAESRGYCQNLAGESAAAGDLYTPCVQSCRSNIKSRPVGRRRW